MNNWIENASITWNRRRYVWCMRTSEIGCNDVSDIGELLVSVLYLRNVVHYLLKRISMQLNLIQDKRNLRSKQNFHFQLSK